MADYTYKGRDPSGRWVEGRIEANSGNLAAKKLFRAGITPLHIAQKSSNIAWGQQLVAYFNHGAPTQKDIMLWANQMAILLRSGVSLIQGLKAVLASTKQSMFRNVLIQVILSLESGFSLSQSLVQHKHIFSGITLALIEVGENTGELENSFYQIKKMMESDGENAKRIKTALRYPLFVLIAIMFAIGVVNVLVIPSFKSFFMSFDAQLPLPTRILIACSDVLVEHGFILLLLMASSLMFALWYARLPAGKLGLSWFFIHIPYVGTLVKRCIYARFCRAFSMTLKANVPLVQAFTVVAHVAHNPFIAQKINTMRQYVEHGDSFYLAAQKSELFGDLELQMLMVGEETGKLDAILLEMANFYENDLDYDLKNLSTAIEPVLIIVVSGFVLVLALGVFLPMWDISAVALRNVNGG